MECDEAFILADQKVFEKTGQHLSDIQNQVFVGSFHNQTYEEIASQSGYDSGYVGQIGADLWQQLSGAFGEPVTKKRLRTVLIAHKNKQFPSHSQETQDQHPPRYLDDPALSNPQETKPQCLPEFPDGPVPPDSPFYIERSAIESLCCQTILQSGSLLRIKAPRLMGKTSLILRILDYAKSQGYEQKRLSLVGDVESNILADSYKFLRWFCKRVGHALGLEDRLNQYWDAQLMGNMTNCTDYFESYLLPELKQPLVLSLDDIDQIFPHISTATDFFSMLRNWHEKGRTRPIWRRLRLVIAHSTEVYIQLNINHSPFNVGIPIQLPELTAEQVKDLAVRHSLNWTESEINPLMKLVGGHPYLVRRAMYYDIASRDTPLEQLIYDAATDGGIYRDHLRRYWDNLQQNPDLATVLKNIMGSSNPIKVEREQGYKLQSMGLIKWEGNYVAPSCDLYRQYFSK